MNALVRFDSKQVALIKQTVAKDADDEEFNLFVEMCKARGLNPLTRQIFCQIYNKDNLAKRQMVIVVSREGQRSIAERTGSYRPDEQPTRFVTCEKIPASNPAGLVSAEVAVYKYAKDGWYPVPAVAYWEEFAPLIEGPEDERWEETGETWPDTGKPKKKKITSGEIITKLDPSKQNWRKMPRLMLEKCAEMAALRKAFPDDFGGLYGEEEMDRGDILDLTPTEMAEKSAREDRLAKIGGPDTYIIDWLDGNELQSVPGRLFGDQLMAFIESCKDEPSTVRVWKDRNIHSFRQFWAAHKSEALELNKALEKAIKSVDGNQIDLDEAIAAHPVSDIKAAAGA